MTQNYKKEEERSYQGKSELNKESHNQTSDSRTLSFGQNVLPPGPSMNNEGWGAL